MTSHSYPLITKGKNLKGHQDSSFLVLDAKGRESIRPKAKGPHHHIFKIQNFNWYFIWFGFTNSIGIISFGICFKNPLDKLRGEFLHGELLFSQRKSI
jgi:hypothetical protein